VTQESPEPKRYVWERSFDQKLKLFEDSYHQGRYLCLLVKCYLRLETGHEKLALLGQADASGGGITILKRL
jgi:hypothetical protein